MPRDIIILSIISGGYFFTMRLLFAFLPIYFQEIGFLPSQIGALMAVFPLSTLFLILPFGILTDRFQPKGLIVIGFLLFQFCLIVFKYFTFFYLLLGIMLIGGIGGTLLRVSSDSLFYKTIGDRGRGWRFGVLDSCLTLGFGLGPFVGGFVLRFGGFDMLLSVAPLTLIPFLAICLFLKEGGSSETSPYKSSLSWRIQPGVFLLLCIAFMFALHIGVENVWLSLWLKDEFGLRETQIGSIYLGIGFTLSISSLGAGFLADRTKDPVFLMWIGLCISGCLNILLPLMQTPAAALMSRMLHVVGDSIFLLSVRVLVSDLFRRERVGGGIGLTLGVFTLGIFGGSLLSGLFYGPKCPFVLAGVLSILTVFIVMALKKSVEIHS
jgi:MFS family permease